MRKKKKETHVVDEFSACQAPAVDEVLAVEGGVVGGIVLGIVCGGVGVDGPVLSANELASPGGTGQSTGYHRIPRCRVGRRGGNT